MKRSSKITTSFAKLDAPKDNGSHGETYHAQTLQITLPEPPWYYLKEVCKRWEINVTHLLRLAVDEHVMLYAFGNPPYGGGTYLKSVGQSVERPEEWDKKGQFVVVTPEAALALLQDETCKLENWKTKSGDQWTGYWRPGGARYLWLRRSRLIIFTDEKTRLEEMHKVKDVAPQLENMAGGITKTQVLNAFGSLVKFNLKKALENGKGLFGEDGARTQKGTPGGKHAALWNPVVLAVGLNEKNLVPMLHLKRAFIDNQFLSPWGDKWREALDLLDE